ncbi:AAA family ATPase [Phyllobacterium myrsinacearum]|uniref:NadR/Ttd14 AAA domain-containing protein n=1 Tax=Phyllobacterium myrsinacearum TaxID=28101 RepID=A0A839ES98_9HYPH|nr:AAA family ATPase [Phyllobacterium myrsinacearum]MBA8881799.1 hypothetical protein [Phyllobacterium myrsinacearum]
MLYGLTGAHRSGKTTLGTALAEDLEGLHFHATSTTAVAKAHGFDPVAPMSLAERLKLQRILLSDHIKTVQALPRPLVVDRTPLDYLGYLLAEFNMTSARNTTPEVLDEATSFVNECLDAALTYYDMIFYLSPLPSYEAAEGKPDLNKPFQWHHALLVQGSLAMLEGRLPYMIIEDTTHDFRRDFVQNQIVERMDHIDIMTRQSPYQ